MPTASAQDFSPTVSVIVAAYNRSAVLRHALVSAMRQHFVDFEVLVIGDACTDDTSDVVAALADQRFNFINLPINYGEQSGPNNVGASRARGRYLAFLNQDDLWFPDHLTAAVAWLEATSSDIVMAGGILLGTVGDPANPDDWHALRTGTGRRGRYHPVATKAYASTLLVKRTTHLDLGGWRPARELHGESSQEFLFRAWRRGYSLHTIPHISVVMPASGGRPGAYKRSDSIEHDRLARRMDDPDDFRLFLLERCRPESPPSTLKRLGDAALRTLASLGVAPNEIYHRIVEGEQRASFINRLRRKRGLELLEASDPSLPLLRARYLKHLPRGDSGQVFDFSTQGNSRLVTLSGWHAPEAWGTWTDGHEASVLFRFLQPSPGGATLEADVGAYLPQAASTLNADVLVSDTVVARWTFDRMENEAGRRLANIPHELAQGKTDMAISFRIDQPRRPVDWGDSADVRSVGLSMRKLALSMASAIEVKT